MNIQPIHPKKNQRFFLQPRDPNEDLTYANARTTEMLHAKHQMPDRHDAAPEERTIERSPSGDPVTITRKKNERGFYEVTDLDPHLLGKIYRTQRWENIPITLLNSIGKGKVREYQPQKGKRSIGSQIKKANTDRQKKLAVAGLLRQGIVKFAQ